MFTDYLIVKTPELPPIARPYEYLMGSNGLFIRARRQGLEVQFPIAPATVRGLAVLESYFQFDYPPVPADMTHRLLFQAQLQGHKEILFYLRHDFSGWLLDIPDQQKGAGFCRPNDDAAESPYAKALINCHSHHSMLARFSPQDDIEEQGFRLYAVIGTLFTQPTIRLRVGVYGYFWEIPAEYVFELPSNLICALGESL